MSSTTRKQTPSQDRKAAQESDYTPLYAVAGLTDAVAEAVRKNVAETQERAAQRQSERAAQVKANADEVRQFLGTLPEQLKTLPQTTRDRLTGLQQQAGVLRTQANSTYTELAGRGKRVVDGAVATAKDLSSKAERRAEDIRADVVDRVDPAFEKVQETVTMARQNVTGRTATETLTPRSAAKAATTRAVNAEREEVRKAAARKAAARRAAARKEAAAAEATVKPTAKKTADKKTAAPKAATPKNAPGAEAAAATGTSAPEAPGASE